MDALIDLHNHSLPGLDDGAEDWEMSMQMLELAYRDGIREIILTPHQKPNGHGAPRKVVQGVFDRLVDRASLAYPDLKLHLGAEILFGSDLLESGDALPTMAGSDYVLVEFVPTASSRQIFHGINALVGAGYVPILAHVERYLCVRKVPELAVQFADTGALLQVNAGSILGESGLRTKLFCRELLRQRLVSFVASDAHDPKRRPPSLLRCEDYVERKISESYAFRLFRENPKKVIQNKMI